MPYPSRIELALLHANTLEELREVLYHEAKWKPTSPPHRRAKNMPIPTTPYTDNGSTYSTVEEIEELYEKSVTIKMREWRDM